MQYSLRMYLLFHTTVLASTVLRNGTRSPIETELLKRCESAIAGFSLTRSVLLKRVSRFAERRVENASSCSTG